MRLDLASFEGECVYIYRDAVDTVLYVGLTSSLFSRTGTHASSSPWFPYATSIEILQYGSRHEADEAERDMIDRLRPRYNNRLRVGGGQPGTIEFDGAGMRRLRKTRGITQNGLAGSVDVSQSYIAALEGGTRAPAARTIMRIARALNVAAADLLIDPEDS